MPSEAQKHARGRPRGAYRKSAEVQSSILDAALEVFSQSGYRAGSLAQIAQKVGLSEAGVLHHFSSKNELLTAVLQHRDEVTLQLVPMGGDGLNRLSAALERARNNVRQPGVVGLFTVLSAEATSPDHPAHQYFVQRYQNTRRELAWAFNDIKEHGYLREDVDVDSAAALTTAVWDGLQIQSLMEPGSVDVPGELHRHIRNLVTAELPPYSRAGAETNPTPGD